MATALDVLDSGSHVLVSDDLYGLTLLIPPLRERLEELPALIAAELKAAAGRQGKKITVIPPEGMARLLAHDWRGNLRELNHTVRTMTLLCDGDPREGDDKTDRPSHRRPSASGRTIQRHRRQSDLRRLGRRQFCIPLHWMRRSSRVADRWKKHKHPIQEAEDAERRVLARAALAFDEFQLSRFRAENTEPFAFEWVDYTHSV
jgi:DNA-binding NtrC family response regulator